jgi:uncharacterized protein
VSTSIQSYPRLSEIRIHPLKSGAIQQVKTVPIGPEGLAADRRLLVLDQNDQMLTAREAPRLLQIEARIEEASVVLMAPQHLPLHLSTARHGRTFKNTSIWGRNASGFLLGLAANEWVTRVIGQRASIIMMNDKPSPSEFNFSDVEPVLIACEESVADVASRASIPVTMDRFRPNLVVSGHSPFDEDDWEVIRIGAVEFDVIGPCERCKMVSINPQSPLAPLSAEPLSTLAAYRRDAKGMVYLGLLARPRTRGRVSVGDEMTVVKRRQRFTFLPGKKPLALALRTTTELTLRCVRIIDEAPGVKTFRFVPENAPIPNYEPGQSIRIGVKVGTSVERRRYTLSSSPSRPAFLSITVKREGLASSALHDDLHVGDTLSAELPSGEFHLMSKPAAKILMLGAGSGITPFLSMLTWITDNNVPFDIACDISFPTEENAIAAPDLKLIEKQLGSRLRLNRRFTKQGQPRLDRFEILDLYPDVLERAIYACGPPSYLKSVRSAFAGIEGFDPRNLLMESFGVASPTVGSVQDREVSGAGSFAIRFARSGIVAEAAASQTILDIARSAGLAVSSSCEAGLCGTCRVGVISGTWTMSPQCADADRDALSQDEKARGLVLACTTRPASTMEIDL